VYSSRTWPAVLPGVSEATRGDNSSAIRPKFRACHAARKFRLSPTTSSASKAASPRCADHGRQRLSAFFASAFSRNWPAISRHGGRGFGSAFCSAGW
jgi:hypothetical protein